MARKSKPSSQSRAVEYEVRLTHSAEAAYTRYTDHARRAEERGDADSTHCTLLRQIDDAIENIIPRDPFNKKYALVGKLRAIYRLHKGRMRICWIGSSSRGIIHILFISETPRKAGDANDPYEILSRKVAAGHYDEVFQQIGMKPRVKQVSDTVQ